MIAPVTAGVVEMIFAYLNHVACQHFCKFKKAGSNFKNTHVHILVKGDIEATSNPDGYSGIGHDDETPGLSDPSDAKHNTVSKDDSCEFSNPEGKAIYPLDLKAFSPMCGYFHAAPADPSVDCPEGYFRVLCPCGPMCVTWDYKSYEKWRHTQRAEKPRKR